MTQYNNIPTMYKGIRFRSRLEANWAAFLDLMQWPWEYEAVELSGYIPDFVLKFPHERALLEVKPAVTMEALYEHTEKIEQSGWDDMALLVGATLLVDPQVPNERCLGLYGFATDPEYRASDDPAWVWEEGTSLSVCGSCHRPMIFTSGPSCIACGADGTALRKKTGRFDLPLLVDYIDGLWAEAKNKTQWKKPKD